MKRFFLLFMLLMPAKVLANTKILAFPMGPLFKVIYQDQTNFINSYSRPGIYTNKIDYLYRLTFKEDFYTTFYNVTNDKSLITNRISQQQLDIIKDYVLYGYEQLPFKSDDCYLALQKLIYETYPNVESVLYTNNHETYLDYSSCEQQIVDLVNINKTGPKLTTLTGDINTFYSSEDLNNILNQYQIVDASGDFMISGNHLIGNLYQPQYHLTLSRQLKPIGNDSYYYRSNTDLLADFKFDSPQTINITITANQYPIKIINTDVAGNIINNESSWSILNNQNELIKTFKSIGVYEDSLLIPAGTYYLKQTNPPDQYLLNENVYELVIDDKVNNTIEIINDRDKRLFDITPNNDLKPFKITEKKDKIIVDNPIKKVINKSDNIVKTAINKSVVLNELKKPKSTAIREEKSFKISMNNMMPFLLFSLLIYIKKKALLINLF